MRIAIDFDGVIHKYESPWTTADDIADGPVPGAIEWLRSLLEAGHEIVLNTCRFTTRYNATFGLFRTKAWDREDSTKSDLDDRMVAMEDWFGRHDGLDVFEHPRFMVFTGQSKPHAHVYVDDRGYRFEGEFPPAEVLEDLGRDTWNQSHHPDG